MKKQLFWLIAAILMVSPLLTSCSSNDNPTQEPVAPTPEPEVSTPFFKALSEIPNVHDIKEFRETAEYGFKEGYEFFFDQPIDHKNPATGTFQQLVRVCVRDVNIPTVVYTEGYLLSPIIQTIDLAEALGTNHIQIEHRYFGDSKVLSDTRWEYLTFEQAAADHHAIIQALKPLLPKEWISTGVSKNGQASVVLRYYYPDDIDVTTAFCAPFPTSAVDPSLGRWSQLESGKGDIKPVIDSHVNRMIVNGKDGLYARYCQLVEEKAAADGKPYIALPFEKYVYKILYKNYANYMTKDAKQRPTMAPPIDSPNDTLINYYFKGYDIYGEESGEYDEYYWEERVSYPFGIQKAKQIGTEGFDYSLLPQLEGTGFDESLLNDPKANPLDLFECDRWLYDTYDNSLFMDVLNNFLPNFDKPMLLVYSQNDPCTGAGVTKVNPVAKLIMNPDGIHNHDINNPDHYSPALRQEIIDYIGKYVKLP